jgi:hypothetical protein
MMICSKLAFLGLHRTDHITFLATTVRTEQTEQTEQNRMGGEQDGGASVRCYQGFYRERRREINKEYCSLYVGS